MPTPYPDIYQFIANLDRMIPEFPGRDEDRNLAHEVGTVVINVARRYPSNARPPGSVKWGADEVEIGQAVLAWLRDEANRSRVFP